MAFNNNNNFNNSFNNFSIFSSNQGILNNIFNDISMLGMNTFIGNDIYNEDPYQNFYTMFENTEELYQNLENFRQNYYEEATLDTHLDYIHKIYKFRKENNGEFPTKKQFYLSFRNSCFCRFYVADDNMFVLAADFFMNKLGDITNLTCANVYYFSEFYTIERRPPQSIREFNLYISRSMLSVINPDFFTTESPSNPVSKSKIDQLKDKIFTFTYSFKGKEDLKEYEKESCSICQDDIQDNQKVIRLDCGHYYHANNKECCENGDIFKWFEHNNSCPLCRKEV